MKNIICILTVLLPVYLLGLTSCHDEPWDEMPDKLSEFVSEYFGGTIESYVENSSGYIVTIKNGAVLTFDNDMSWTDVNGRGELLPQQFLYDCLPETLYHYLEGTESLGDVYRVTRTYRQITVELSDDTVIYNTQSQLIKGRRTL